MITTVCRLSLALLAVNAVACGGTGSTQLSPTTYEVTCIDHGDCHKEASKACAGSYDVKDSRGTSDSQALVHSSTWIVECE